MEDSAPWMAAAGYVGAAGVLIAAMWLRHDPRVVARLDPSAGGRGRRSVTAAVGRRWPAPRSRAALARELAEADERAGNLDHLLGRKALTAAVGIVTGLSAWPSGPAAALLLAGILGAAGYRLPNFVLARRVARRRAAAEAAVPELIDLVAVSVTAGLTPRLALDRSAGAVRGPLAVELAAARRRVALGGSWRVALRDAGSRTGLRDLQRLAVTLERSTRLGSPVADQVRALARDVRAERRAREEERARRAPVTMLFPLVFLILPAFVLAAVVPAVLVAMRGID